MHLGEGARVLSQRLLQLRGDVGKDAEVVVAVAEEQRVPEALWLQPQQREEVALAHSIQQVVHVPAPHTPLQTLPSE